MKGTAFALALAIVVALASCVDRNPARPEEPAAMRADDFPPEIEGAEQGPEAPREIYIDANPDFIAQVIEGGAAIAIVAYSSESAHAQIPESIGGLPVVEIGDWAFRGRGLLSAVIPHSVRRIGRWAFADNDLSGIEIPAGIALIDAGAFFGNRIESLTVPGGVERVGDWAFAHNAIARLAIESSGTIIGQGAFAENQIAVASLPTNAARVAASAFDGNPALAEGGIRAPLGMHARFDPDHDFDARLIDDGAAIEIVGYEGAGTEPRVPPTIWGLPVVAIGEWAFAREDLIGVTIPDSVRRVDENAFGLFQLSGTAIGESLEFAGRAAFARGLLHDGRFGNTMIHVLISELSPRREDAEDEESPAENIYGIVDIEDSEAGASGFPWSLPGMDESDSGRGAPAEDASQAEEDADDDQ
ncbi:MAG: leucine-rich repeat domain-containing protein [Treponema sp.]|nr:leucine-rich repeat domain-containing protein [Treponema sp.]